MLLLLLLLLLEKSKPLKNLQKREIKLENLLVIVIAEKQKNKDTFSNIENEEKYGKWSHLLLLLLELLLFTILTMRFTVDERKPKRLKIW